VGIVNEGAEVKHEGNGGNVSVFRKGEDRRQGYGGYTGGYRI
jgi:hypothetical protein